MYDGTVRNDGNGGGQIIQFRYGEDGFDPLYLEHQTIDIYNVSEEEIYSTMFACAKAIGTEIKTKWYNTICDAKHNLQKLFPYRAEGRWYQPIRPTHYLHYGGRHFQVQTVFDAGYWEDAYALLMKCIVELRSVDERQSNRNSLQQPLIFECLLLQHLNPNELQLYECSLVKLQWILQSILQMWNKSYICPGEKVGVIASQSIGQLAMQSTLYVCFEVSCTLILTLAI